jgi:hypothetical protein
VNVVSTLRCRVCITVLLMLIRPLHLYTVSCCCSDDAYPDPAIRALHAKKLACAQFHKLNILLYVTYVNLTLDKTVLLSNLSVYVFDPMFNKKLPPRVSS